MSRRSTSLRGPVLLLSLLAGLAVTGRAEAHRLDAQCFLRPGWRVQVECWYDSGDVPRGARVQVFRDVGPLLLEGRVDRQGVFLFIYPKAEPLRVVVSASGGHRAEVRITAEALRRNATCACVACLSPVPAPVLTAPLLVPIHGLDDQDGQSDLQGSGRLVPLHAEGDWRRLLPGAGAGVGLLLGVAALVWWRRGRRQTSASNPAVRN